jgi:hypothetical protein
MGKKPKKKKKKKRATINNAFDLQSKTFAFKISTTI